MDAEKIRQLINNIISNSIKYTLDDGIIKIKFERIVEGIKISIEDNGRGIATDKIKNVFNKFYRGDTHRNQNIQGSGLGLSIAEYIAKLHNGGIKISSLRNEGTKVIITLKN